MSFSESLVPRPRTMMSRPVALGSSVPQWPTFLMRNWRRMASTTSWEVGPLGLSMSRAPSSAVNSCMAGSARGVDRRFDGGHNAALGGERAADNTCAGRGGMTAAPELATNVADVHFGAFGAKADGR